MNNRKNLFFGVTLEGMNSKVTWSFAHNNDFPYHKLVVKQIALGCEASYEEDNIIEVRSAVNKKIIAILKAGENRTANSKIAFYESKITLKLTKGNGPIHLIGQIIRGNIEIIYASNVGQRPSKLPKRLFSYRD